MLGKGNSTGRKVLVVATTILFVLQMFFLFLVPSLHLSKAEAASGNVYYVAKNGSDSNPGTEAQPLLTIQKAIDKSQSGDTIFVRGGVYNECAVFTNKTNITLKNYPGETPIIRGKSGTLQRGIIVINSSSSYITVDGFLMDEDMITERGDPNDKPIYAIYVYGNHNTIQNITIRGSSALDKFSPYAGIGVRTGDYNLIQNNVITGIKYDAGGVGANRYWGFGVYIGMAGAHHNIIRNNTILRCHSDAIFLGGTGSSENEYPHYTTIEYNTLGESRQEDGIMFDCAYVEGQDWRIQGCTIRYNTIYNNPENGIDLKGTKNIQIYGNTIYGNQGNDEGSYDGVSDRNGGNGAIMHGWGTKSTDVSIHNNLIYDNMGGILIESDYKVFNNVIYANNRDYSGSNSTYDAGVIFFAGIQMHGLSASPSNYADVVIKNNIVSGHRHGEVALKGSLAGNLDIDNNLYFDYIDPVSGQNKGTRFMKYEAGYAYLGFSQWKQYLGQFVGITGKEANSLVADPAFVNLSGHDFHLQLGSPAIDAGTSTNAPSTDLEGTSRPQGSAYDIGAYEYQDNPANPTSPSVVVVSPANGSTVSGSVPIEASASDDEAVSKVEFYLDGEYDSEDTAAPYAMKWYTNYYSRGNHTITAKAYDNNGNSSSHSVTVFVNNVALPSFVSNEVIVKFKVGTSQGTIDSIISQNNLGVISKIDSGGIYRFRIPTGISVPHMISKLLNASEVEYAEPNYGVDRSQESVDNVSDAVVSGLAGEDQFTQNELSKSASQESENKLESAEKESQNKAQNKLSELARKESQDKSEKNQNKENQPAPPVAGSKNELPFAATSALGSFVTTLILGLCVVFKKLLLFLAS